MYRSVIVPLDGSTFAEHALPCASKLASEFGAKLCLLHVHPSIPSAHVFQVSLTAEANFEAHVQGRIADYLTSVADRYKAAGNEVETSYSTGHVVPELRAAIEKNNGDLVVMTTHGRGGMARFWLGSTADQLVRETNLPMLLLRPGNDVTPDLAAPGFRRLLVTLDGSRESEQILPHAVALGQPGSTEVRLLRVVPPRVPIVYPAPREGHGRCDDLEQEALTYLGGIATGIASNRVNVTVDVITNVNPAMAVLEYAKRESIDLIAMATHGRGGVRRMLLGSVADKVLRGASTPMLVLRPG